jgi:hypothetical protein
LKNELSASRPLTFVAKVRGFISPQKLAWARVCLLDFVDYLGGTIDLVPQQPGLYGYTTVSLDLGFRAFDPSVNASTVFAAGKVTIDLRGLFDMQAHAGVQVFAGIGAA